MKPEKYTFGLGGCGEWEKDTEPMMEKAKNWDVLERTGQNKSSQKKSASHSACTKTGASPSLIVALL